MAEEVAVIEVGVRRESEGPAVRTSDSGLELSDSKRQPSRSQEPGGGSPPVLSARLGMLTHMTLAAVPLDADAAALEPIVALHARIVGATDAECRAASEMAAAALGHPLLARARAADRTGRCRRETPVTLMDEDGTLIEGVVDLAFEDDDGWTVVDFKTARELERGLDVYKRQVALYAQAIAAATARPTRGVLMHLGGDSHERDGRGSTSR